MRKTPVLALIGSLILAILSVLIVSAQDATPAPTATPPFGNRNIQLFVEFDQKFATLHCPDGSPAGAFCLTVTGTTTSPTFGDLSLERTLVADISGEHDEFGGAAITSNGTLTDSDGDTLEFALRGALYLREGAADYRYIITGGTGKFDGAQGHGVVTIPPPTSNSIGTEIWLGSLRLKP